MSKKKDKWPERCTARSPGGGITKDGKLPRKGKRCGNYVGHHGDHTVLQPTGAPWFGKP